MSRRRTPISYAGLDQSDDDDDFADDIPDVSSRPPSAGSSASRLKRARHIAQNDSPQGSLKTAPQEEPMMSPKGTADSRAEVVPDTSDESTPCRAGSDADAVPEVSPARTPARTPSRTPTRARGRNDDDARSDSSFDPDEACSDSDFSDPEPEPEPATPPKSKKRAPAKPATSKTKPKAKASTKSKGVSEGRVSKPSTKPPARPSGGLKQRRTGIAIPTSVPRVPGATERRPRRVGLSRTANVPRLLKSYKG